MNSIELLSSLNRDQILAEKMRRLNIKKYGRLSEYIKGAWPIIEPGREYMHNWHIDLICEYLEAVKLGQITRLIINMPPRHMKSIAVTVAFPTWLWTTNPEKRFICASYAQALATKHSIDRRAIIRSDWYRQNFGASFVMSDDNDQKMEYSNNHRGVMTATSVGGTATGKGGDILIVDDPQNPRTADSEVEREGANTWFDKTLSTRLDDKRTGAMIVVMQRLHELDLTGHLLEKGGWEHLKIQGQAQERVIYSIPGKSNEIVREAGEYIWQEREGEAEHIRIKNDLGLEEYSSQYQQEPAPDSGIIFKKVDLCFWYPKGYAAPPKYVAYTETSERVECEQMELLLDMDSEYQSWDLAFTGNQNSDYVVGQVWGILRANRFLLDQTREKLDFLKTVSAIIDLSKKYPRATTKFIEKKANADAIYSALRNDVPGISLVEPKTGKIERAKATLPLFRGKNVYLPHPCYFPWVDDLILEMTTFPKARNDDQVDGMTQFLNETRDTLVSFSGLDGLIGTKRKVEF